MADPVNLLHANHENVEVTVVGDEVRLSVPVTNGVDGEDGVGVPAGGDPGYVLRKGSGLDYDAEWAPETGLVYEAVAGAVGFMNVSGAVSMNVGIARAFHHTMTGNITSLAFIGVPNPDEFDTSWRWVLRIDGTGGYLLSSVPAVVWVDGSAWGDLDLSANAENIVTFWQVGAITYAALITNGRLVLDPYPMTFQEDGTLLVAVTRDETVDLGNVTHLEADGTPGTGTLTFKKNGGSNLALQKIDFDAGEVLTVTLTGSSTLSAVSIPRYAR